MILNVKFSELSRKFGITFSSISKTFDANFGEVQTFDKISITAIFDNNPFTYLNATFISYIDDNGQENNLSLGNWGVTESPVTGTFTKTLTNVKIKKFTLKNWCILTGNVKLQIEMAAHKDGRTINSWVNKIFKEYFEGEKK